MTRTLLVINGAESPMPQRDGGNLFTSVYRSMLLQICRDFPGLPDVRALSAGQIKFFYQALKPELMRSNG